MCGICGFYQIEKEANERILKEMNNQIIHRGPDDEGYYYEEPVGLAARRLSIIDLHTGHQPLPSDSMKNWITYNGEVYNFAELREELLNKGYQFRTKTDTEVVVNLYEEYGIEFVKKLRGMFAIGIYDKKKDRLVLTRDHTGIKPLYYCIKSNNKNLIFGSEIKSILKYPNIIREMDLEALDLFFTLEYIPAPYSIFKNIRKIPAGHLLTYEKGKLNIIKYWDAIHYNTPEEVGDLKDHHNKCVNFNELKEQFHSLLKEAVKMRMIADVPLGAFLSGGIDSSSIVATMSALSSQPVKTFSIGFAEKSYSELEYADSISKKFKTDHYTRILSPNIAELVLNLTDIWDEPLGDFSNFPTYLVSKTAREKVTVVLSGDGGDEIFGGYEHYIAQKIARFIDSPIIRPFHRIISRLTHLFPPSQLKKGFTNRIKRFSEGLENSYHCRHFRWMIFLSNIQKQHLYSPDFLDKNFLKPISKRNPFNDLFKQSKQLNGINQDLFLDLKTYMVDNILVKVDRMSMANSLEARVPLLDHKMVEFAFTLPPQFKLGGTSGSTTKWFFKKSMENILPQDIIYRQKEGFSIPIKNWLKDELKEIMMEYLSEKRLKESGLFNHTFVNKMIQEHLSNQQNHAHRLWTLILFHLWREKFYQASSF